MKDRASSSPAAPPLKTVPLAQLTPEGHEQRVRELCQTIPEGQALANLELRAVLGLTDTAHRVLGVAPGLADCRLRVGQKIYWIRPRPDKA